MIGANAHERARARAQTKWDTFARRAYLGGVVAPYAALLACFVAAAAPLPLHAPGEAGGPPERAWGVVGARWALYGCGPVMLLRKCWAQGGLGSAGDLDRDGDGVVTWAEVPSPPTSAHACIYESLLAPARA